MRTLSLMLLLAAVLPQCYSQEYVKEKGGYAEYFIFMNKKRHIPDERTRDKMKFDRGLIKEMGKADLDKIENEEPYPSLSGDIVLMRGKDTLAVYHVYNGRKHHIPDEQTFNHLGLDWRNVSEVPVGELERYATGKNHSHIDGYRHLTTARNDKRYNSINDFIRTLTQNEHELKDTELGRRMKEHLRNLAQGNERDAGIDTLMIRNNGDFRFIAWIRNRQVAGRVNVPYYENGRIMHRQVDVVTFDATLRANVHGNLIQNTIYGDIKFGHVEMTLQQLIQLIMAFA